MTYTSISPSIYTEKIDESRKFYTRHLNADIIFDSGWFVHLRLGKGENAPEIAFMSPREETDIPFNGKGLTYNIKVNNADNEYTRITGAGIHPLIPIENHPWGDRGFAVLDPNGIVIYIYHPIEPTDEFRPYFKNG